MSRPASAVAVRASVEVSISGTRREHTIEAWFRPHPTPELRVDLGPFAIWAYEDSQQESTTTTVVVTHRNDRVGYVRGEFSGPLSLANLGRVLPPIPMPMLSVWLGDPSLSTPGLPAVAWQQPRTTEDGIARLVGESPDGPAMAVIDAWGVRSWRQSIRLNDRPATIEIKAEPFDPPTGDWAINLEDRRERTTLSGLQPTQSTIARFEPVPALPLFTASRTAWSFPAVVAAPTVGSPEPFSLLLLVRAEASADGRLAIGPALEAIERADSRIAQTFQSRREAGDDVTPITLEPHVVLVFELADFSFDTLAALRDEMPAEASTLWTAAPAATIARFSPGSATGLVVVDGYRRLVSVMDPSRTDLADAIVESVTEEAWLERARRLRESTSSTPTIGSGGG